MLKSTRRRDLHRRGCHHSREGDSPPLKDGLLTLAQGEGEGVAPVPRGVKLLAILQRPHVVHCTGGSSANHVKGAKQDTLLLPGARINCRDVQHALRFRVHRAKLISYRPNPTTHFNQHHALRECLKVRQNSQQREKKRGNTSRIWQAPPFQGALERSFQYREHLIQWGRTDTDSGTR
jgi:hypothetical protein